MHTKKSSKPTFMLSPCGTSLLTNLTGNGGQNLTRTYANAAEAEIEKNDLSQLQSMVDKARDLLLQSDFKDVCRHSAELNAISRYYEMGRSVNNQDIHILLASNTWLGKQTAGLVKEWLERHGVTVRVEVQADLTTDNLVHFQSAMSDLVKFCEEEVEPYRQANRHVVFNLTGGFKSVQGFLQTLAMFYADEAIYIFQSQDELLRLPRLPVKMDAEEVVRSHLNTFRRLSKNIPVKKEQLSDIPEVFYIGIDEEFIFSPWGELAWNQVKKNIYEQQIFESPHQQIQYSEKFIKSVQGLSPKRNVQINERLDDLMRMKEFDDNLHRLRFKALAGNPVSGSTHQFYAYSDGDARRIFCHFEGPVIVLDKYDKHL